ncbi:MAG: phosphatase PAP2 family protein [Prevotella sp.]|nr:phosphatase PAP2 family protein [Prevotella sp.]
MYMEELIQLDKQLLLMVNGSDSLFLDYLVMTLTNAKTWIPLYIALFYVVLKANNTVRDILLVLAAAGLCVLLAGTVDDMLVKPTVARWRPGHDPEIGLLVDTVDGYRGGKYGFFSAHASNTFSIALFFSLLMRRRLLVLTMLAYSLLNCLTRLYLGVHYPGDITVGLLWGALVGYSVYRLHRRYATPVSYSEPLCDVPIAVFALTLVYALGRAYANAFLT